MRNAAAWQPNGWCILAAMLGVGGCTEKRPAPVSMPPPVVMVSVPLERQVTDYQIFTARTQAVQSVEIKARVTGYLTEVCFKDGELVDSGKTLFKIDDRPYKAALEQAKATLEFAKASLVKAEADYEIGVGVQKKDKGAISTQEIVRRLGARDEARASVEQAKAALENAQLNFDWCTVTAPITGRCNTHFVDVGNVVSKDVTTLTNIVSLKPVWAYFDVDQNTVLEVSRLVEEGKANKVRADGPPVHMGLANVGRFPFDGHIDFISNQLDPNTGSIRARAVFPNDDGLLAAGLFGRLKVPIGRPHDALMVADSAIGTDQSQRYVLVVNDQNEVEYRIVEVGQLHGQLREVSRYRTVVDPGVNDRSKKIEVLKPGERIVVEGLQRVRPGVKVEPKMVDMLSMLTTPAAPTAPKSKAKP